ncbi:MAG: cation transporter, partial [Bacteroidetes bacterium]|nr:cation transporter [Bacteroidota bacterium]
MDGLFGTIEANDDVVGFNSDRNLSFKSSLFEVSSQIELNFFPYTTGNKDKNYFTPYLFIGVSFFSFNPKASYDGVWYDLQPLGTEGQGNSVYPDRKPYSLVGLSCPFGIGLKYSVGSSICIGAEWGLRKTNTDYIDDVSTTYPNLAVVSAEHGAIAAILSDRSFSALEDNVDHTDLQRGNSVSKDWYSFAGLFITPNLSRSLSRRKSVKTEPKKGQTDIKQRVIYLSLGAAVTTIVLKFTAFLLTGSVGLLSDAAESLVNLVGASVALVALIIAARPADKTHSYGHNKAEYFSSTIEGSLI